MALVLPTPLKDVYQKKAETIKLLADAVKKIDEEIADSIEPDDSVSSQPKPSSISADNQAKPSGSSSDNQTKPTSDSSSNQPKPVSDSSSSQSKPTSISVDNQPKPSNTSNGSESDWTKGKAGDCRVIIVDGIEYAFRYCPAGTYTIGSPSSEEDRGSDETQHEVIFSEPYWMLETEVTQKMWQSVMGDNPSYFKGDDLPVEMVSWNACQDFIQKLNSKGIAPDGWVFSLPTEAEWEVAARAGSKTAFPWGNILNGDKANCNGNYPYGTDTKGKYLEKTCAVKSYFPNVWGVYDTTGNVVEWCLDQYGDYPKTVEIDYLGKGRSRVVRGGGWSDSAQLCRSAYRCYRDSSDAYSFLGFRCALARALVRQQQEQTLIKPQLSDTSGDNQSKVSSISADDQSKPSSSSSDNQTKPTSVSASNQSKLASDSVSNQPKPTSVSASNQSKPSNTSNGSVSDWTKGKAGDRRVIMIDGIEYVFRYCPTGCYTIGSPSSEEGRRSDETQHDVIFSEPYWMLETEVTQKMWQSVMGNNPSRFTGDDLPVEQVSWINCQYFIRKLNDKGIAPEGWVFSLPTEAEWEVAARAGSKTAFPWGNTLNGDKANCNGNNPYGRITKGKYLGQTCTVKSYFPNTWGLYDMAGNVWEWCLDEYSDYPKTVKTDYLDRRGVSCVNRGGGWLSSAQNCRSANRNFDSSSDSYDSLGFRCSLVRALVRQ